MVRSAIEAASAIGAGVGVLHQDIDRAVKELIQHPHDVVAQLHLWIELLPSSDV